MIICRNGEAVYSQRNTGNPCSKAINSEDKINNKVVSLPDLSCTSLRFKKQEVRGQEERHETLWIMTIRNHTKNCKATIQRADIQFPSLVPGANGEPNALANTQEAYVRNAYWIPRAFIGFQSGFTKTDPLTVWEKERSNFQMPPLASWANQIEAPSSIPASSSGSAYETKKITFWLKLLVQIE